MSLLIFFISSDRANQRSHSPDWFTRIDVSSHNQSSQFNNFIKMIKTVNNLDLRDLRYFEAIASTGHLGRASELVHRSQPALTSCIRRLEKALGVTLIERAGRGIQVTPAGQVLLERARTLRLRVEEVAREISDIESGLVGHIRIGVLPTLARFFMPSLCRRLLESSPNAQIRTTIAQSDVLADLLERREVDLILTIADQHSEDYVTQTVFEDEAVVIASNGHPIFKKRRVNLAEMLKYRWVLAPRTVGTRIWIEAVCKSHGLRGPDVQIETNQILIMPSLICETQLLAFTSRLHLSKGDTLSSLQEVRLDDTTMKRKFNLAYRRDVYLPPVGHQFIRLLSDEQRRPVADAY